MTDRTAGTFVQERQKLIAIARRIVNDPAAAEDIVQESWLRWHGRAYPEERSSAIFKRIVSNLAKDWYRRQKMEWANLKSYAFLQDNAPDTERVVIARQELAAVVEALERLPKRSLEAFRLSRIEGLTYAEIAKRLRVAESTAYGLVADALVTVTLAVNR